MEDECSELEKKCLALTRQVQEGRIKLKSFFSHCLPFEVSNKLMRRSVVIYSLNSGIKEKGISPLGVITKDIYADMMKAYARQIKPSALFKNIHLVTFTLLIE